MRFLVTGGAGYVGSISVRHLIEKGHEVTVLDSLERGHRRALHPDARLVVGDIGDADTCITAAQGVDAVLHCAAYIEVAESEAQPELYMRNNAEKPGVLLEVMGRLGIGALVFSSTAAVYGQPETMPIGEDAPLEPVNAYGRSKVALERHIEALESGGMLRAVRLRYFNVAGAWQDGSIGEAHTPESHIVPRVLGAAVSRSGRFEVYGSDYPTPDGTCVRDYVHVCDLAQAHALALERVAGGGPGGVFNLGSQRGFSNLEVVECCREVTGSELEVTFGPRRPGDPPTLIASSEKAKRELGWSPERGELATMVTDAWAWHSAHPEGYAPES